MPYIPKEFWLDRGKVYKKQFQYNERYALQERMLIEYLRSISTFSTVLELGCGFGRITKLVLADFPEIQGYVAVDLSSYQIENAKEYVRGTIVKNENLQFIVSDIQSFQTDRRFDLVLLSEVLMHILPDEIVDVMAKIVGLAKRHIINVDMYEENFIPGEDWCFIHPYLAIYKNMPAISGVNRIPIVRKGSFSELNIKQSIFHAQVRNDVSTR